MVKIRTINCPCGCKLEENGINICMTHFVMFEDKLMENKKVNDITIYKHKYTNGKGWLNIPQELYSQIVHCINVESKDWIAN